MLGLIVDKKKFRQSRMTVVYVVIHHILVEVVQGMVLFNINHECVYRCVYIYKQCIGMCESVHQSIW